MEFPLNLVRQTASVLLGLSIHKLFPSAQLISAGVNELGFFYDFISDVPLNSSVLVLLEETMRFHAKEAYFMVPREMMRENAADFFLHRQQPFIAEKIELSSYNIVQLVEIGDWIDRAPLEYAESTDCVSIFKLYDVEEISFLSEGEEFSAYRVTGEVFRDKQQSKKFTKRLKEQKEIGSQVLVKAMELFLVDPSITELQNVWLPKGKAMLDLILSLWRREWERAGVFEVKTPALVKKSLLKENDKAPSREVFFEVANEIDDYRVMQSPVEAHARLYQLKSRQEFDLPIRYSEVKDVYLEDASMTQLGGILKSPSQLMDFIHSFCAFEQLGEELISSLQFIKKVGNILGLGCQWSLCLRKGKSAIRQKLWDQAVTFMREALTTSDCVYTEDSQESAITGPFLRGDFCDRLGRKWSGPQISVDFQLPTRLGLCYINSEGQGKTPILLKVSSFGPLERLIALLLEKEEGRLPLWLTPEQVRIISVGDALGPYARSVLRKLQQAGVRTSGDLRSHSLGCSLGMKIHEFENAKVPYALIVGNHEEKEKIVTVRKWGCQSAALKMDIDSFLQQLHRESAFIIPEDVEST